MKRLATGCATALLSTLVLSGISHAVPVRSISNLTSITFYETTGNPIPNSFQYSINSPQLTNRLADPLSATNNDFVGVPDKEFYDVFYSNANGVFNLDGEYLTIEGVFGAALPAGGGLNLAEIGLGFSGGGSSEFGNFVASYVILGDNFDASKILNAIDGNLQTFTVMGNTLGTSQRLRLTLGFLSSSGPAPIPVPAALPLFVTGVAALGFAGRRRRQAASVAA